MTLLTKEKRVARALSLADEIETFGLDKLVSSDEAWFFLTGNEGMRKIHHLIHGQTREDAEVYPKKSHPQDVLPWIGICDRSLIGPIFVKTGAKINSEVNINCEACAKF